jgi:hypothetical protein
MHAKRAIRQGTVLPLQVLQLVHVHSDWEVGPLGDRALSGYSGHKSSTRRCG